MKIVDAFIFYNEVDLLRYRLNVLNDVVDYFIIVEGTTTFVGNKKKSYYNEIKHEFYDINNKIIHFICELKSNDNNTNIIDPWDNENMQRNYINEGIKKIDLCDNDYIILSDVDELPDIKTILKLKNKTIKTDDFFSLEQDFYYYNLYTKHIKKWYLSKIINYKYYCSKMNDDLNFIRNEKYCINILKNGGWHLSYFGNSKFIINKLQNYSHVDHNIPEICNCDFVNIKISTNKGLFKDDNSFKYKNIKDNKYLPYDYEVYLEKYI